MRVLHCCCCRLASLVTGSFRLTLTFAHSHSCTRTHRKPNIFDNMLAIMEKHAHILEQRVYERTKELDCEKKKTEMLLLRMLPK